ncbi:MAG: isochorismatase family cysteine hydrolase [Thermodesulforhabdaceae bacterium]
MSVEKVLLVIDMLNDFLHPKGKLYCGDSVRNKIIKPSAELIAWFRNRGYPVIYVQDAHDENDPEFKRFPRHAIKNTWGGEFIDEIKPQPGDIIVTKPRFSALFQTNLDEILAKYNPKEIWVIGVCTSICVMDTVVDLRYRDYTVVLPLPCLGDINPRQHDCALERMDVIFGAKLLWSIPQ